METLPIPEISTDIINTETIGTVTADTLRQGAEKINSNFTSLFIYLQDLQDYICAVNNIVCSSNPKIYISPFLHEFDSQYIPTQGDVVHFNSNGKYGPALAEFTDSQEAVGVIYNVMGSRVLLSLEGYICNLTDLSPGKQYYLSPIDPGKVVTIDELDRCDIAKPIFIAISDTEAIVNIKRGQIKGDLAIDYLSRFIEYNDVNTESIIIAIFTPPIRSRSVSYNDINIESVIASLFTPPNIKLIISYNDINVESVVDRGYTTPVNQALISESVAFNDINVESVIDRTYTDPVNQPIASSSIVYNDIVVEAVIDR